MKLILIRHGRTEANEKHLYCGSADLPLSEEGKRQLIRMRRVGCYPDIEGMRVVTSGKRRCEETLALLYGAVPHEVQPCFCEMDFGAFELCSYEMLKEDPRYQQWISGDNEENTAPGGESGNRMKARVLAGLLELEKEGQDTLLVTHGGVIAAVMAHLFWQEKKNRYQWQPPPGGGYEIDTGEGTYFSIGEETPSSRIR